MRAPRVRQVDVNPKGDREDKETMVGRAVSFPGCVGGSPTHRTTELAGPP